MNRRLFAKWGLGMASMSGLVSIPTLAGTKKKKLKNVFIHHVYFWLKNPESETDKAKLLEGLVLLTKCKSIQSFHIGVPASTSRDVIDGSYTFSWFTTFANAADEQAYQVDPIHDKFRNDYHDLWSRVIVYDSVYA